MEEILLLLPPRIPEIASLTLTERKSRIIRPESEITRFYKRSLMICSEDQELLRMILHLSRETMRTEFVINKK